MIAATADWNEFAPPSPPGRGPALSLALVAHVLLLLALAWGVNWKHQSDTVAVEAELWASVPKQAAPRAHTPVKPTPKPVSPLAAPPEPPKVKPLPPPPPPPAPDTAQRDADIALAKRKQEKAEREQQELARERREKAEKDASAKKATDQKAAEKRAADKKVADARLAQEKLEKEKLEKEKEAKALKAAEAQKKEDAARDKQQAAESEAQRQANLKRIAGLATATGSANATGKDDKTAGSSGSYAGKVAAKVKPNIVFADDISGNPVAEVEVRAGPTGAILSRKLVKSSGVKAWDDAVIKAIDKTDKLPADTDGRVPGALIISFRPHD